ncbi:MAG: thioesterase family protein [Oscillospiraceae bacterium]|nr:thioesterase family protein [Oscillospiraceae bacterium]
MKEITIGTKASAVMPVTEEQTAKHVGSGSLRVFATPMMAALMEKAACEAIAPFLEAGETTVGTELNIRHSAATPVGLTVTAEAEVTAVNGREIAFTVTARDDAGEIGSGTHKRFLVFAEKFQSKADGRGK